MSFALFIVGAVLLIASVRNTQGALFNLLQGDFVGPNNFIYWFTAILLIGFVGYIPKLKPISVAMLTLVVIVLVLKRGQSSNLAGGGLFQQLTTAIGSTQAVSAAGLPASAGAAPSGGYLAPLPVTPGILPQQGAA